MSTRGAVLQAIAIAVCGLLLAFFGCLGIVVVGTSPGEIVNDNAFAGGLLVFGAVGALTVAVLIRFLKRGGNDSLQG
jgi:hypothetical protein